MPVISSTVSTALLGLTIRRRELRFQRGEKDSQRGRVEEGDVAHVDLSRLALELVEPGPQFEGGVDVQFAA